MKSLRTNLLALVGLLVFACGVSITTEAAAQTVSLQPIVSQLGPILTVLVAALITFLGTQLSVWLGRKFKLDGLKVDEMFRKYLQDAAFAGINYALTKIEKSKYTEIEVKNKIVQIAANYVLDRVPDAVKRFGLDSEALKKYLEARVGPFDVTKVAKSEPDTVPIYDATSGKVSNTKKS